VPVLRVHGARASNRLATRTDQRHRAVSDLNDRYPHDDADVIEIKQAMDNTSIPLVPIDAANIMRDVDDVDADRGGAAGNPPAPPSSGTRDLAAMVMFDLDPER
jgi:hypothetical protein